MAMINSVIMGTQAHADLVPWENKYLYGESDTLGEVYWNRFKRSNGHLICSKRGKNYELDKDK